MAAGFYGLKETERFVEPFRKQAEEYDLSKINDVSLPSFIYDRYGREIGRVFDENRSLIARDQIPDVMVEALISGEDSRFLTHDGVDYMGIVRAMYLNAKAGRQTQGASTITQQLARNAFPIKEDCAARGQSGYQRKLVEAFLAQRIEKEYTKDEILTFYLNRIAFGSGFYGLHAASRGYFGKEPMMLTRVECATLVGCIKNPSVFSPLNDLEANRKSRNNVISRMAVEGYISESEAEELQDQPVALNSKPFQRGTTYLYKQIFDRALLQVGEQDFQRGGYKIYTTIDADVQKAAEQSLERQLAAVEARSGYRHPKHFDYRKRRSEKTDYLQGALLMTNHKTGEVIAYVGGRDYKHSQYDLIESGSHSLGTAFFPFVYAAGFSRQESPVSLLEDEAMDNRAVMVGGFEGILAEWGMESSRPVYEGDITARRALAASKIAATVRFGNRVGLAEVLETAKQFGFEPSEGELLPRLLVGWDTASMKQVIRAYGTLANFGVTPPAMELLTRIESASGEVIYQNELGGLGERVIDRETAYQLHSCLVDSGESGSAAGVKKLLGDDSFHGAVKTGTTHDFSDNWAVGYNSNLTCAVWTGFPHNAKARIDEPAFSRDTVLPTWAEAMSAATQSGYPGESFIRPETLEAVTICRVSGEQLTRFCYEDRLDQETGSSQLVSTAYTEYLKPGKQGVVYCHLHGPEAGGLGDLLIEFSPDRAPEKDKAILAVPIRPKSQPLVGADPYNSKMPSLVKSEENKGDGPAPKALVVESGVPGDQEAQLHLPQPERLKIIID